MKIAGKIIYIFLFLPCFLWAQESNIDDYPEKNRILKPEYHLYLGSNFGFNPGFGSNINLFAQPSVSLPLSKRFSAEGGMILSKPVRPGFFPGELNNTFQNQFNLAVYGSTVYQASSRLTIYGTGIKQIVNNPPFIPSYFSYPNSFTLGSSFRLSKGITIGASIRVSDSYHDNVLIPGYNRGLISSPFLW